VNRRRRLLYDFGSHRGGGSPANRSSVVVTSGISTGTAVLPATTSPGWLWLCVYCGSPSYSPNGGWSVTRSKGNGTYYVYSLTIPTNGDNPASPTNLPNGPYLAAYVAATVNDSLGETGSGTSTAPSVSSFNAGGYLGRPCVVFCAYAIPAAVTVTLPSGLSGTIPQIEWDSTLTLAGGWFTEAANTNTPVQTASIPSVEAWCTVGECFS